MPNIGPMELIVVLVIVLLVFGPKRLPGLGKQLGSGMREFKDSISGSSKDDDEETDRPALTAAQKADAVVDPADKPASKTSA
ncbi:MAG: Twin-arginine translocation protein TatA [uncultured Solirubrobacteraceae bacterium]|uniref:Sec-independent protein translocase protein TatA n=1 Tax=uncultured Solirubrobacteraceae bacterium TaxID=1162706 RepID=A0A6J4SB87_9ACTN|nr:MAG: Twin-arginine translocation protein TatA [uncultured Solirubrobacteraceae bacterium]